MPEDNESQVPDGAAPLPDLEDPRALASLFEGIGGEPASPVAAVAALIGKATELDEFADVPLGQLVTPESFPHWNLGELAQLPRRYGISSRVRYLSPSWALVALVEDIGQGSTVTSPTYVPVLRVYLRFTHRIGWRVHLITPRELPLNQLP